MSDYTELTNKDLITQVHAMITNLETKLHETTAGIRVNERILQVPGFPAQRRNTVQAQLDKLKLDRSEITAGLVALREELAELEAEAPAENEPAEKPTNGKAKDISHLAAVK